MVEFHHTIYILCLYVFSDLFGFLAAFTYFTCVLIYTHGSGNYNLSTPLKEPHLLEGPRYFKTARV